MTRKELIFISTIFILILCLCIAVQMTEPKQKEDSTPPEPTQAIEAPEPSEPQTEPIEPIHDESYIRYELTDDERTMVERVVAAESRNQPIDGQVAVAQCVLNTAEAENMRPDEVVLQPGQYAPPSSPETVTDSVRQAVAAVFDEGITVTNEPIRFFYAPKYSSGTWHEANLEHVITIQDHKFFKVRDYIMVLFKCVYYYVVLYI